MNLYAKKQSFIWQKAATSAVILIILLFSLNLFQKQTRNSFFYISRPISTAFMAAGRNASDFVNSFFSFTVLKKENYSLQLQNHALLANLSSLQEIFKANQDLETVRQNTENDAFALLQVKVIGLDVQNDTMLIDKGSADGLSENMPVISKEKALFGKISKLYANFSEITLISSKKSALAVKIQTADPLQTPVYGALKGSGNLSVYIDLINADSVIAEGDILVTSAQEGIFPKDLLVGRLASSNANDATAYQSAKVQPFFNPKATDNLFIITNYLKK